MRRTRNHGRATLGAALIAAIAGAGAAQATDGTWLPAPANSDWNNGANWSSSPTVPNGTASFGASNTTDINGTSVTIGTIQLNAGAPAYRYLMGSLTFTGAGIVNNSANAPVLGGSVNFLTFNNASSAGNAVITNTANGGVNFFSSSTAANATIHNLASGSSGIFTTLTFHDSSTAGNATIDNHGETRSFASVTFSESSSAGNATINSTSGFPIAGLAPARVFFTNSSTAGNATLTGDLGSSIQFSDSSTAGNAVISSSGGTGPPGVLFLGVSTGGNARFIITGRGIFDMSGLLAPGMTAGSIEGSGSFVLGAKTLTVGSNNLSTEASGVISGDGGALTKVGSGTLTLSGTNTYTGATTVNAGTLSVNGSIAASSGLTVNSGGTIVGTGALPKTTINGGTLSPGNSIGTVSISGGLTFVGAGNYIVEIAPSAGDRTNVSGTPGTASLAGTIQLIGSGGAYAAGARYVVLNASGGISGAFGNVAISGSFGATTPHIEYDANNVYVVLTPTNALPLAGLMPNQRAVATTVNAAVFSGVSAAPFNALFNLDTAQLPAALDQLSGEAHVSTVGVLADESLYVRSAILGRLRQASYGDVGTMGTMAALNLGGPRAAFADGSELTGATLAYAKSPIVTKAPIRPPQASPDVVFWGQGFGAWGRFDSDGDAASVRRDLAGFITGVDTRLGASGRAGLAAGYTSSRNNLDSRGSANVESAQLAAYGGWSFGALNVRGGGAYAFHTIDTDRTIAFPGFFDRAVAHYDGNTGQIFGEAGYGFALANVAVEPFAGSAWVRVHTDAAAERAPAAGLNFAGATFETGYSTLGVRAASLVPLENGMVLIPRASVAWQHAFNSVTPGAVLAFQAAPAIPFTIAGVPLARDAALAEAGLDLAFSAHATIGVSYTGQIASNVQDHAARGKFSWKF